jgi:hypothetical protein
MMEKLPVDAMVAQSLIRYYRSILEDPSLADNGAEITEEKTGELIDVAIPVGGKRKGGYLECPLCDEAARGLIERLRNHGGFPNVRLESGSAHVAWGEPIPGHGDTGASEEMIIARGRYFGYRESAIKDFVKASKRRNGIKRLFRRNAETFLRDTDVRNGT